MLIGSNVIIDNAQPSYADLRRFIAHHAPAVSAINALEALETAPGAKDGFRELITGKPRARQRSVQRERRLARLQTTFGKAREQQLIFSKAARGIDCLARLPIVGLRRIYFLLLLLRGIFITLR
jgi:hypothetical protein